MLKSGNIFLIGPMGTGKSTIGRQLAEKTGKHFYDSDQEIEQKTGATVSLIFEIEGEPGFRQRECKTIEELSALKNIVLATGGGAILSESNRECLKGNGTVIYLRSSVDTILGRMAKDKQRPLLQTDDKEKKIRELLEQRVPIYEELADYSIDTDGYSVGQMVKKLLQTLELK